MLGGSFFSTDCGLDDGLTVGGEDGGRTGAGGRAGSIFGVASFTGIVFVGGKSCFPIDGLIGGGIGAWACLFIKEFLRSKLGGVGALGFAAAVIGEFIVAGPSSGVRISV